MYFGEIIQHETRELVIIDEITKKPTDVTIELFSLSSKGFKKKVSDFYRAKAKDKDIDSNLLLAYCTKGWKNVVDEKGVEIPCNEKNSLQIYNDYEWVKKQVDSFIAKESNFLSRANID